MRTLAETGREPVEQIVKSSEMFQIPLAIFIAVAKVKSYQRSTISFVQGTN